LSKKATDRLEPALKQMANPVMAAIKTLGVNAATHCVSPLLLQTACDTKLFPVVQLQSGVILLMGDPKLSGWQGHSDLG